MGLPWRRPELERGERRPKIQIHFSFSSVPQVGMTLSLLLPVEYRGGTDMLRMNMLVVSQVVSFNRPNFDGNKTLKTKCSDLRTRYLVIRVTRRPSAQCTRVFILRSPMGLFPYARMPHHQESTDEVMARLAFPLNDGVYWSRLARKVCQKKSF